MDSAPNTTTFKPRNLPYVNYYQYPPLLSCSEIDQNEILERIDLDESLTDPTYAIFVSIPYCLQRCNSCHFFKALLPSNVDRRSYLYDYISYLERECNRYGGTARYSDSKCGSIYFGGGTASLLYPEHVAKILSVISRNFAVDKNTEITLEGNPHQFTREYLMSVRNAGVNRVSLGYQSGADNVLKSINSSHSSSEGIEAIKGALSAGFRSVNVDLMYGMPGQSEDSWKKDIMTVLGLGVPSIKIYQYVIHRESAAAKLISSGKLDAPLDPDVQIKLYSWTKDLLEREGFIEGRKGSFARPGHKQQYGKIAYDCGYELIGIGAGSYSFINGIQFAAPNDPEIYKHKLENDQFPPINRISRKADKTDLMRRHIIFGFMSSRLDRTEFKNRFDTDITSAFPHELIWLFTNKLATDDSRNIALTDLGKQWRKEIFYAFYRP